jgi:hypothetical protein
MAPNSFEKPLCKKDNVRWTTSQWWDIQIHQRQESIKVHAEAPISYYLHQVVGGSSHDPHGEIVRSSSVRRTNFLVLESPYQTLLKIEVEAFDPIEKDSSTLDGG